jgi:outer membrane receptor protein involved in Fe transport
LTLGIFYKDIEGFLWTRQAMVVAGTPTAPEVLKLPDGTLGFDITYPLNSPNRSSIKGFELDIQSNMDFLPVKGFVFNMNLTLMNSQTKYSETLKLRTLNPDYGKVPGAPRIIFTNYDTAYVDRLLKQPGYLANIGIGYDNKKIGLSVRLSYSYQDDILTREQRRTDGADRGVTTAFQRWDFQLNQRIAKRLSLNANIANIFNEPDRSIRCITGYMENLEYYGALAQIGLRYDFY